MTDFLSFFFYWSNQILVAMVQLNFSGNWSNQIAIPIMPIMSSDTEMHKLHWFAKLMLNNGSSVSP